MQAVINLYRNAYVGLSTPAWMLALVMFINRSGSMVVPFLSVYLTKSLHFTIAQAGIVLTFFGLGAMTGSLLGGWLSDKIGSFWVQFLSLTIGGCLFLVLSFITAFESLVAGIFVLSVIVECLRPANSASVALYSKPENVTRSFSLNRMAVNLGFSIGPAVGGLLASLSYRWLFIVDGLTCIAAGIFFFFYFRRYNSKKAQVIQTGRQPVSQIAQSPYKDVRFMVFLLFSTCYAVIFFQLFNTLPLYYRDVYHLPEFYIGLLLGFNGLLVFIFEMITVHSLEKRLRLWQLVCIGTLLCGFSYVLLNLFSGIIILLIAVILLTFSEIFAMPFMVTFTVKRAGESNRGSYIGLYGLSFSAAFILAPYLGTRLITHAGYTTLWWAAGILSVPTALGFIWVMQQKK